MFVSLPVSGRGHGHGRPSVTCSSFLSASQHCKYFALPGSAVAMRNSADVCPSKEVFPKQCHPHNFRVRKLKTAHRAHHWNPKSASKLTVTTADIEVFFRLLEDSVVAAFLERDTCRRFADKYLIAMVFTYFIRANYSWRQYNRYNFFVGLYLAHDMEEDEEEFKFEVLPWLYGGGWRRRYPVLLRRRDALWRQIGYRAVVSRKCCDEVISIRAFHPVWQRTRPDHHSGAFREYLTPDLGLGPFGPHRLPPVCRLCAPEDQVDSDDSGVAYLADSPAGGSGSEGEGAAGGGSPGRMELSDSLLSPATGEETAAETPLPSAAADVTSLNSAGVTSLSSAGVNSLTSAGVTSLTSAGVTSLTSAGVTSLTSSGVTSLTSAAAGVTSLSSDGVTSLTSAAAGVTSLSSDGVPSLTSAGVACLPAVTGAVSQLCSVAACRASSVVD